MPNHSYENVFPLQLQFHENHDHFQMKGFAQELALKQRDKVTQKWPIRNCNIFYPKRSKVLLVLKANFLPGECQN